MAIDYVMGFNPFWYIADNVGRPLGGGSLYAWSSLNPSVPKAIYQDASQFNPWQNPILFNENGQQGPFFFAVDSANPQDGYYLEVYDAAGNLVWDIDNYLPTGGGGGGGGTTVINSNNLVINGVFWRNSGNTASPIAATTTVLAPGVHVGLAAAANTTGPDILFLKNNLSATDQITFVNTPQGSQPLNNDIAPVQYLNYTCTGAGSSETIKCIQIPITAKVQNLTNISVSFSIWARTNTLLSTLSFNWLQYYGDSSPSGTNSGLITTFGTYTFLTTGAWTKIVISGVTIPNIAGATLGGCGNDALFLQIQLPFGQTCNIDLTEPSVFVGSIVPPNSYLSYDQIDAVVLSPRTGTIRNTYNTTADLGWVLMNDGSIGNASSGATTRANIDTFPLYNLLYNATAANPTFAQLQNSSGTPIARTGTAQSNFLANNRLGLTKALGRALANAGLANPGGTNTYAIGQAAGLELQTLITANLPSITLSASPIAISSTGGNTNTIGSGNGDNSKGSFSPQTPLGGSNTPFSIQQPTMYTNFMIKL